MRFSKRWSALRATVTRCRVKVLVCLALVRAVWSDDDDLVEAAIRWLDALETPAADVAALRLRRLGRCRTRAVP